MEYHILTRREQEIPLLYRWWDEFKDKKYPDSILEYTGDILLVTINYDKEKKEHQCLIEEYKKN